MDKDKLASLKDDAESKGNSAKTTKGGIQRVKFTPSVPAARRQKSDSTDVQSGPEPLHGKPNGNQRRNKPVGGLMNTISDTAITGTFAHGFGTFGKIRHEPSNTGSISGLRRASNLEPAVNHQSKSGDTEFKNLESVVDDQDIHSPTTICVPELDGQVPLSSDTLNVLQLPGIFELMDFGDVTFARKKPIRLLDSQEPEKVIDIETFKNAAEKDDDSSSLNNWPADHLSRIGLLNIHQSGRMSLSVGSFQYFIEQGEKNAPSSLWAIDKEYGHIFDVGIVEKSLTSYMLLTQ